VHSLTTPALSHLCSKVYAPQREHTIHPLGSKLDIEWPTNAPLLSDRDAVALTLAEAKARGLLPEYEVCLEWTRSLDMGES
jgi:dTDP-4-dehydrorhamnose 3,5-epimerase